MVRSSRQSHSTTTGRAPAFVVAAVRLLRGITHADLGLRDSLDTGLLRIAVGWRSPAGYGRKRVVGRIGRAEFSSAGFAAETIVQSAGAAITVEDYSVPSLTDWNVDGMLDLIVGEKDAAGGKVRVYLTREQASSRNMMAFAYAQYDGDDLTVPCQGCLGVFPRMVDWNEDGTQDLLLGLADGRVQLFPNTQSRRVPRI